MNVRFSSFGAVASLSLSLAALALTAVGCSGDDDAAEGSGKVKVQHYTADNTTDGPAEEVALPAECANPDDACSSDPTPCDGALAKLCREGTTQFLCASIAGSLQIGCSPPQGPRADAGADAE